MLQMSLKYKYSRKIKSSEFISFSRSWSFSSEFSDCLTSLVTCLLTSWWCTMWHWPYVTNFSGYPPIGLWFKEGRWAPHLHSSWGMAHFTFTLQCDMKSAGVCRSWLCWVWIAAKDNNGPAVVQWSADTAVAGRETGEYHKWSGIDGRLILYAWRPTGTNCPGMHSCASGAARPPRRVYEQRECCSASFCSFASLLFSISNY